MSPTSSPGTPPESNRLVGFVGVGHMGRPMVDRLVAAGVRTEVFARRAEVRDGLAAAGIPTAASAADLASRSDVLILCLFRDEQVRELMIDGGALAVMKPGSVLISHVTGSPALSRDLQLAAPSGVAVLDVPISGTDDHIRRGGLTLMVGGDTEALDRVRDVLSVYGQPILSVGGLGDGQRVKLINNLLFAVNLRTALAAARLGASLGVPPSELARVLSECSGGSFAIELFRRFDPEQLAGGARHYLVKDVTTVRAVAEEQGVELGELGDLAQWVFET